MLTTSAQTPGFKGHLRAYNIFKVIDPGLPTETREADFTQVWDAGEELQARNLQSDPRTIYFSADGSSSTLLDFVEAGSGGDLTAAQLGVSAGFLSDYDPLDDGAATAADAAEIVEKTIRGWRLVITASDGFYDPLVPGKLNWSQYENDGVTGTWKLFESTRSAPASRAQPAALARCRSAGTGPRVSDLLRRRDQSPNHCLPRDARRHDASLPGGQRVRALWVRSA